MAENKTDPRVKEFYDYAQGTVDEQAILDKFNAATRAQFDIQREQNRQAENQFYNQMYNTQRTAMDTIRKSNAAAVSSGASRGVQAANELSALLGLQQESVQSATEIAQQNRQTAQEETAAVLENVLNAYQQASQERSQLTQQGIEAASLEATEQQASAQNRDIDQKERDALQKAAATNFDAYLAEVAGQQKNYSGDYSLEGANSLNQALSSLTAKGENNPNTGIYFDTGDFAKSGTSNTAIEKNDQLKQYYKTISDTYGLNLENDKDFQELQNTLTDIVNKKTRWSDSGWGKFVNFLTLGLSGGIEDLAQGTGTGNFFSETGRLIPAGAIADIFITDNDVTPERLQKASQTAYNLLNEYIKSKYKNKQVQQ